MCVVSLLINVSITSQTLPVYCNTGNKRFNNNSNVACAELDSSGEKQQSSIIRLSAIREIMERNKHAVLDITPSAVDRLNYAQFYPIVIYLRVDSKQAVKEMRAGFPKWVCVSKRTTELRGLCCGLWLDWTARPMLRTVTGLNCQSCEGPYLMELPGLWEWPYLIELPWL